MLFYRCFYVWVCVCVCVIKYILSPPFQLYPPPSAIFCISFYLRTDISSTDWNLLKKTVGQILTTELLSSASSSFHRLKHTPQFTLVSWYAKTNHSPPCQNPLLPIHTPHLLLKYFSCCCFRSMEGIFFFPHHLTRDSKMKKNKMEEDGRGMKEKHNNNN